MNNFSTACRSFIIENIGADYRIMRALGAHGKTAVHVLENAGDRFILKTDKNPGDDRLKTEQDGVRFLHNKVPDLHTPEIVAFGQYESESYLITEYITPGRASVQTWETFGGALATLHLLRAEEFGYPLDNFIGQLPQQNTVDKDWISFYYYQRLLPQFQVAVQNSYFEKKNIPTYEIYRLAVSEFLKDIHPSPLHGDLWNGNYIISDSGEIYLIDPSVYWGHSMVDIAMTKLFGGFDQVFYKAYFDIIGKRLFIEQQIDLYQLYYLLVHLNLFGRSYLSAVMSILKRLRLT